MNSCHHRIGRPSLFLSGRLCRPLRRKRGGLMDTPTDIDGLWSGHSVLHGKRYRITVRFAQNGSNLRGTMTDEVLHFENSLAEVQKQEGWSDQIIADLASSLYEQVPDADGAPIVYVAHLPAAAALSGFAQGS